MPDDTSIATRLHLSSEDQINRHQQYEINHKKAACAAVILEYFKEQFSRINPLDEFLLDES